jgi:outer membrane lipoprotein-sorting protein
MDRNTLAAAAAVLALAASAPAQTVDEVVARSFEARGGLEKIEAVRSLRMTGRATVAPGTEAPITIEIKRPSRLRIELRFESGRAVQAYDGQKAWGIPPGESLPRVLPAEAAKSMAQQTDIEGPLAHYAAKGHRVELVGRVKVDGEDAWKLRVTRKDGDVEYHYLDARSYLPVLVAVERSVRGTSIRSETRLGDYRKIGAGFLWPFLLESGASGRAERQRMKLQDVEVDPAIDDARFAMPASGRD